MNLIKSIFQSSKKTGLLLMLLICLIMQLQTAEAAATWQQADGPESGIDNNFVAASVATSTAPLKLHVDGRTVKNENGEVVLLRGINFNHYMEMPYYGDSLDAFHKRLQWTHSEYDYRKVKSWGLNTIRLNISYIHIEDSTALENLKNNVFWAKAHGTYIIIGYFVPPGGKKEAGYYSNADFWTAIRSSIGNSVDENDETFKRYLDNWNTLSSAFKDEPHVLYELLNEPQLTTQPNDKSLYVDFVKKTISKIRESENGVNHIVIVDGLSNSDSEPQYFSFIKDLTGFDANIVYSFHSYHPRDFIWQECYWDLTDCNQFRGQPKTLTDTDFGWQEQLTFSGIALADSKPVLSVGCNKQPGACLFKKIELFDESSQQLVFTENFTDKVADSSVNNSEATDGKLTDTVNTCGSWTTVSNGQYGSAKGSMISLDQTSGEKVLSIASTVNEDNAVTYNDYEGNWSVANFWGFRDCSTMTIDPARTYVMKITMKGYGFASYGSASVKFVRQTDFSNPLWERSFFRYKETGFTEKQVPLALSSDKDMIQANFKMMEKLSIAYDVPFFMGEFGTPIRFATTGDDIKYLKMMLDNAESTGFGWSLFVYREIFNAANDTNDISCGSVAGGKCRTFGLFSGWGITVSEMEQNGLGTDPDLSPYFYRPNIISYIKNRFSAYEPVLYSSFAGAGIWKYSGTGMDWDQVTTSNPELLVTVGSTLYGTFSGLGIWKFTGTDWEQTTTSVPQMIVGSATTLYGAFSGLGIWQWNGSAWTQTTSSNPQKIVASTVDLYGTFAGLGIWKWNGTAWTQLTTSIPDLLVTSGEKLYGTFAGQGIWLWNGTAWAQATPNTPQMIAANSTTLYGTFKGQGIWSWDGASTWTKISTDTPTQMTASGTELYAAFSGVGIKKWDGTSWTLISGNEPVRMVVGE